MINVFSKAAYSDTICFIEGPANFFGVKIYIQLTYICP